jgi:hypothetical protein
MHQPTGKRAGGRDSPGKCRYRLDEIDAGRQRMARADSSENKRSRFGKENRGGPEHKEKKWRQQKSRAKSPSPRSTEKASTNPSEMMLVLPRSRSVWIWLLQPTAVFQSGKLRTRQLNKLAILNMKLLPNIHFVWIYWPCKQTNSKILSSRAAAFPEVFPLSIDSKTVRSSVGPWERSRSGKRAKRFDSIRGSWFHHGSWSILTE